MKITYGADLSSRNTFGMKVKAAALLEYDSAGQLAALLGDLRFSGELPLPLFHIGSGSNLLFTGDFPGTILHSGIDFLEWGEADAGGRVTVKAGAAVLWDELCAQAALRGLWGPENLSLIPGEVGAAAVQNIGAYGREVCQLISQVEVLDLSTRKLELLPCDVCGYGYRSSFFKTRWKGRYIVTAVTFTFFVGPQPRLDYGRLGEILASHYPDGVLTPVRIRETVIGIRRDKLPDPAVLGSAGSFFRNPFMLPEQYAAVCRVAEAEGMGPVPHFVNPDGTVKVPAAWLIEKCGWKGRVLGHAAVYERQPLVIVNADGKAAPEDIMALEDAVVASVRDKFNISLTPEVEHI